MGTRHFLLGLFWFAILFFLGCGSKKGEGDVTGSSAFSANQVCAKASRAVTPLQAEKFVPASYEKRGFLAPPNHLGEDVAAAEGAPVAAAAAGTVVFYGPASGYGELLAVVEHRLVEPITVRNGAGGFTTTAVFLSITGHIRPSQTRGGVPLNHKAGDCVAEGTVIGFVNDASHNGDGAEHIHFGARLSSDAEAHARDGATAYRGYDTVDGKWKGDFAAFHDVLAELSAAATWHPDGALIQALGRPEIWRIENGRRRHIPSEGDFERGRYYTAGLGSIWNRVITVTETELSCYEAGPDDVFPRATRLISCADGVFLAPGNGARRYKSSVAPTAPEFDELARSWGFNPLEIFSVAPECSLSVSNWPMYLRDGTLVKELGKSDVYFIASSVAWPIDSWDTFLAFGFKQTNIQTVPPGKLKGMVLSVSSTLLDASFLHRCMAAYGLWCTDQVCMASIGGGTGETNGTAGSGGVAGSGGSTGVGGAGGTAGSGGSGASAGVSGAGGTSGSGGSAGSGGSGGDIDAGAVSDAAPVFDSGALPEVGQNSSGRKVRVSYPATNCLNTDMVGGWTKICSNGSFDHEWQNVPNGLKRLNYFVNGQWLCGESAPGAVVTPFGLPQVWIDGAPAQAFAIHDWRMSWGCNIMICVGGACELCCDGKDTDGDGLSDQSDPDCVDVAACL